eukprot:366453_1
MRSKCVGYCLVNSSQPQNNTNNLKQYNLQPTRKRSSIQSTRSATSQPTIQPTFTSTVQSARNSTSQFIIPKLLQSPSIPMTPVSKMARAYPHSAGVNAHMSPVPFPKITPYSAGATNANTSTLPFSFGQTSRTPIPLQSKQIINNNNNNNGIKKINNN